MPGINNVGEFIEMSNDLSKLWNGLAKVKRAVDDALMSDFGGDIPDNDTELGEASKAAVRMLQKWLKTGPPGIDISKPQEPEPPHQIINCQKLNDGTMIFLKKYPRGQNFLYLIEAKTSTGKSATQQFEGKKEDIEKNLMRAFDFEMDDEMTFDQLSPSFDRIKVAVGEKYAKLEWRIVESF